MEHIHNTDNNFVFENVMVNKPLSIQNGNFLMRITKNGNPLYVQTPKCHIKQPKQEVSLNGSSAENNENKTEGLEKTKRRPVKKNYCDFVVSNEHERFIKWFDDLERHIQQKIFENHNKWFDIDLELEDIELSFSETLKRTKTNKSSILRTNLPNLEKTVLKIYNEDEEEIPFESLNDAMSVMSILEIQGIKYSSRSFQIDIELKQMLVMKDVNIFDKCIFKPTRNTIPEPVSAKPLETFEIIENEIPKKEYEEETVEPTTETTILDVLENSENIQIQKIDTDNEDSLEKTENIDENETDKIDNEDSLEKTENVEEDETDKINNEESLGKSNFEFQEIELDLDEIPEEEKVEIKQRNTVYYEMYKEARRKAKVARDLALSSYLEAKRIKKTYMLDDIIDSDESSLEFGEEEDSDEESVGENENEVSKEETEKIQNDDSENVEIKDDEIN